MTRVPIENGIAGGCCGVRNAAVVRRLSLPGILIALIAACALAIFAGAVAYCFVTGNVGSPF